MPLMQHERFARDPLDLASIFFGSVGQVFVFDTPIRISLVETPNAVKPRRFCALTTPHSKCRPKFAGALQFFEVVECNQASFCFGWEIIRLTHEESATSELILRGHQRIEKVGRENHVDIGTKDVFPFGPLDPNVQGSRSVPKTARRRMIHRCLDLFGCLFHGIAMLIRAAKVAQNDFDVVTGNALLPTQTAQTILEA